MNKVLSFKNQIFRKKELKDLMYSTFTSYGLHQASQLVNDMKNLGFKFATQAGISISIEDLKITPNKQNILSVATLDIQEAEHRYIRGEISSIERFQTIINIWNNTSEAVKNSLVDFFEQSDPLNPIYLMAFSGARGNLSQVRQLVGMRGLMADPNGQIIDIPIIHNFREGLTITDYIMSSFGARKGVVDTALKTADSGYLTRRLVDVAQDVIIREYDCKTLRHVVLYRRKFSANELSLKLVGRTLARDITTCINGNGQNWKNFSKTRQIDKQMADELVYTSNLSEFKIRSPLTCDSTRSICQLCYGWNLASSTIVNLGEAVGILAAQSIGEPGTQLTMRTFHTGGIFTADPSRQVRARSAGLIEFDPDTPSRFGRTIYGTDVRILDQVANLKLVSYENKIDLFSIPINSSIFVSPFSFVYENQLIAELPLTNQQTLRSKKEVLSPLSGQVYPDFSNELVWVLQGQVYDTVYQSLLNELSLKFPLESLDRLTSSKIVSPLSGLVKPQIKSDRKLLNFSVLSTVGALNMPVFRSSDGRFLILVSKAKNFYWFTLEDKSLSSSRSLRLFSTYNFSFQIPTQGAFYSLPTKLINRRFFFLSEELKQINKDRSLALIESNTQIEIPGIEIVRGIFSETSGFLRFGESNNIIQQVSIKPGIFFEYSLSDSSHINEIKSLHNSIFYRGEILFDEIFVPFLSCLEVIIDSQQKVLGLLLRPLIDFHFSKKNLLSGRFFAFDSLFSMGNNYFSFEPCPNLPSIIEGGSNCSYIKAYHDLELKNSLGLDFYPLGNTPLLIFIDEQKIDFSYLIPRSLQQKPLFFSLLIRPGQFIERGTIIGKLTSCSDSGSFGAIIKAFEVQNDVTRKVFLTLDSHWLDLFSDFPLFNHLDTFLKVGDSLSSQISCSFSGKSINPTPFKTTIHKAAPIFCTKSMQLYKLSGGLIFEAEPLGFITFDQIITGDIVQGLPKIEEILEARKPHSAAQLSLSPGLVYGIEMNDASANISLVNLTAKGGVSEVQSVNLKKLGHELRIMVNEYVSVGQPLTSGPINPHDLLLVLFNYYKNYMSCYDATFLTFKSVQTLLINKVQEVYNSQGVDIADKHLEIIIRQITSRVKITSPGSTLLVQGEIVDFRQVQYINQVMKSTRKREAFYFPLLLGITKASLLTDSFISAASFQETTKILTSAAVEGKVDWLRGLKENVIIGRLIPAGRGFKSDNTKNFPPLTFF